MDVMTSPGPRCATQHGFDLLMQAHSPRSSATTSRAVLDAVIKMATDFMSNARAQAQLITTWRSPLCDRVRGNFPIASVCACISASPSQF